MREFSTSLLREKFVIHDLAAAPGAKPVIALSNRMVCEHRDDRGRIVDNLVVRAQSMHLCARMAARLLQAFRQDMAISEQRFDWPVTWKSITNGYEERYNPNRWIAVYSDGRMLFEDGRRHPFLDVIERCDARNTGIYDDSIKLAEEAFKKTGKKVRIEYDGNIALVANLEERQGRCGIILRSANGTTTFNFSTAAPAGKTLNFAQVLMAGAAFLEGIQLSFLVGTNQEKIRLGLIAKRSPEEKKTRLAGNLLSRLANEINNLEREFTVRYRPERPEFGLFIQQAEKNVQKTSVS